jgi:hypothetical protein
MANTTYYVDTDVVGGDSSGSSWVNAFSTLSAWEALNLNLTTGATDGNCTVYCRGTTADTTAVTIDGWTTDAGGQIYIIGNYNPSGIALAINYDTYFMQAAAHFIALITISDDYVNINNLQFDCNNYASNGITVTTSTGIIISNCIGGNTTNVNGNPVFRSAGVATFINCVAYNNAKGGFQVQAFGTTNWYNCTSYGNGNGFERVGGDAPVATNCIGNANGDNFNGTITTSYCCSDTASEISGTGDRSGTTGDVSFVDVGAGTEDFHLLSSDTNAIDLGTSLSGTFTTDIDGQTRSGSWDIGADEYASVAGSASVSPSASPSVSPSVSPSKSPSVSPSKSPSVSPSASYSPSKSPSVSPSVSPSKSPSKSPSVSPSASYSPSLSPSVSPSKSPSVSPSASYSPSVSPSVSPSISPSASYSPSKSPSISPSLSPSQSPSLSPSASYSPSLSPSVSPSLSPSASYSPSMSESASPSPSGGLFTSASLSPSASPSISPSASYSPSTSESASPSVSPSVSPSGSPSLSPSASYSPSQSPSVSPSLSPSISPSLSPSLSPSASYSPSKSPSQSPSLSPSVSPSISPSASYSPSASPSISPSLSPSLSPSKSPSLSPSASYSPSKSPSQSPSISPSLSPSQSPSLSPSASYSPSVSESASPSQSPSVSVSASPSISPSASYSPSQSPSVSASKSPSVSASPSYSPSTSISASPSPSMEIATVNFQANQFPVALPNDVTDPHFIPALRRILEETYNFIDYKFIVKSGVKSHNIESVNATILNGDIPQANLNVADRGWVQSCGFSVTDADTIAWGSGIFTSAGGLNYSISAGNTSNMVAKTYIYLDIAVSNGAYQTTTTATTAVGVGKVMIAVAQNGTTEATYLVLQGQGGKNIDASEIVAGSITANEIAASTITGGKIAANTIEAGNIKALTITAAELAADSVTATKIDVTSLSAISADLGTITAGTVTGATIRTAASGARTVLSTDDIQIYNSAGNLTGDLGTDWLGDKILIKGYYGAGIRIYDATNTENATLYYYDSGSLHWLQLACTANMEIETVGLFRVQCSNILYLNPIADGCAVTINGDSVDADTNIGGHNTTALLYCDAGNNRVGIMTNVPSTALDVTGTTTTTILSTPTANITTANISGFTSLGTGNTGIRIGEITGTTAAAEGGSTTVAHNLTYTQIISITAIVGVSSITGCITPGYTNVAGYEYYVNASGGNITVDLHATNSENILSKPFSVVVIYKST